MEQDRPPEEDHHLPWLLRSGMWLNVLVIAGLACSYPLLLRWRASQFSGYGLSAVYYEGTDFKGNVLRRGLESNIDFSDETHEHFRHGKFSAEWTGTIVLPRAGRYTFATDSDDASWLYIDGELVVDNSGLHGLRRRNGFRMLDAGPHAIKIRYFQAGVGAVMRIFWTPAGRRGGLEYIPPTVLFPEAPKDVDFSRARPIPPLDFPIFLILSLELLLACLVLARRPLRQGLTFLVRNRQARLDLVIFLLIFAAGLGVRMWDLHAAGRTWDEDVYWTAGRNFVQNVLAADWRAESWAWNSEHPAMGKWIYAPATLISDSFSPARAVSAILGALTCALIFIAGRDLLSRRVGVMGAGLCVVMPHIIAHNKIIGLETPTGFLYTLAVWLFFRGMRREGNSGYHLAAGLCGGMLLATRVSNLSVFLVMGVMYLVASRRAILAERRFPVPLTLGLAPVVVCLVFFGVWPYLWENPMNHLGQMLIHWKPDRFLEWYLGLKQKPNWYYFPLYFVVTIPVGALAALALSSLRSCFRRDFGHLTLLVWFFAPFIVMFSPLARDGVRYLYAALFPACLLMASGLDWLVSVVSRLLHRKRVETFLAASLGTALCVYVLYCGRTVHPYYLDYYNELTGGPARVAEKHIFETAWWGEGLKEAIDYIGRNADKGATVMVHAHPTHVVNLREDLKRVDHVPQADYVIFNNLFNSLPKDLNHDLQYVVRAAGAPLVWVYQRKGTEDEG